MPQARYRCRDCKGPIDRNPPKLKGQPAAGYCECVDAAWLLPADRKPVKLVVRTARGGEVDVDTLEERAVLITTVTEPPIARR